MIRGAGITLGRHGVAGEATGRRREPRMGRSSHVALALTVATGVTVNWLSGLYQPSLVPVLLASIIVLLAVSLYERRVTSEQDAGNGGTSSRAWIDPVKLSFLSFVFAIIAMW